MYFEVDDIKRRHTPYWDITNIHGWVDPPDDHWTWHWFRGSVAGIAGTLTSAAVAHRYEAYRTLRQRFHPPESFQQAYDFMKAIKTIPNYEQVR